MVNVKLDTVPVRFQAKNIRNKEDTAKRPFTFYSHSLPVVFLLDPIQFCQSSNVLVYSAQVFVLEMKLGKRSVCICCREYVYEFRIRLR